MNSIVVASRRSESLTIETFRSWKPTILRSQRILRRWIRWVWVYFVYYSGLAYWARLRLKASGGVIVLTLHRVLEDSQASVARSPMGMVVRKSTFHELLNYLKKRCEIIRLEEAFAPRTATSKPQFAITFDDGWKDTGSVAFPLIEQFGMPITLFVCPGLVDKRSAFWPERVIGVWRAASVNRDRKQLFAAVCRAGGLKDSLPSTGNSRSDEDTLISRLKSLSAQHLRVFLVKVEKLSDQWGCDEAGDQLEGTLSWPELIRLHQRGVIIGSHTQNHAILTQLQQPQIAGELAESRKEIEHVLNRKCNLFAYPNGSWSSVAREQVRKSGYTHAFANETGFWIPGDDAYVVPRINIWEGTITGLLRHFSPAAFEYATYWRSRRTLLDSTPSYTTDSEMADQSDRDTQESNEES